MSYILDALKKAQAERQLGDTPTIHAGSLQPGAGVADAAPWRKPVWWALGILLLAVLVMGLLLWRNGAPGVQPQAAAVPATQPAAGASQPVVDVAQSTEPMPSSSGTQPAPAVAITGVTPAAPAPALEAQGKQAPAVATQPHPPMGVATQQSPAAAVAAQGNPAPAAAIPARSTPANATPPASMAARQVAPGAPATEAVRSVSTETPPAPVASARSATADAAAVPVATSQATAAPAPAAAPVADDTLPSLRELPGSLQQQIPTLAMGGYIYSKNPADRLLLVDKVLRHEGEEVAPGLVLEKLQPKSAVFNFRGTRYRVPY